MSVKTHELAADESGPARSMKLAFNVVLGAWLLLLCASDLRAQDLITTGPVKDGRASVITRDNGEVLVAFEREDTIDATVYNRIFLTVSLDGGSTFLPPQPFRTTLASDREPTLIETASGLVYLYYTSNQSGVDRIWAANSFTATDWNMFVSPLALMGGTEEPVGRPSAVLSPDGTAGAYLAFENRATGRVLVELLDGFLTPTMPIDISAGVEPTLLLLGDTMTLAWREGTDIRAAGRLLLAPWTEPFTVFGGLPFQDPNLALLPNSSLALFVGIDLGPSQRVMRALSLGPSFPPVFDPPELIPAGDFNIVQPFAIVDDPLNPGRMSVYVSLLEEDDTIHLMRAGMGACDAAPTFGGVRATVDEDPCTDTGVLVSWDAPTDWGSAMDGVYELHRLDAPGQLIDETTFVWRGPELSVVDVPPVAGQTYWYAVLAVGTEACVEEWRGTAGLVAGHDVELAAIDYSGGQAPDEVKGLHLSKAVGSDLRFEWSSTMAGDSYVIGASTTPEEPLRDSFVAVAPPTPVESLVLTPSPDSLTYYAVWAISPCGVEGSP